MSGAAAIRVRALGLDVVDTAGAVLATAGYFDPVAPVVELLSRSTGAAPVVEELTGDPEYESGTSYQWGGLEVVDPDLPAESPGMPEWSIVVSVSTAGSLSVSTSDLVAVGLSRSEVESLSPSATFVPGATEGTESYAEAEVTRVGASTGSGDMVSHRVFLVLRGEPASVAEMRAPSPVGGH